MKRLLVLIFIMIQCFGTMAQKEYSIKINLPSSKVIVWEAVTDFQSYDQWNTVLIMGNNDQLEIGKKFKVTIINENGKKSKFKALTLTNNKEASFSARQTVLGKWFFSVTHYFIIEENKESETTFIQTWKFSGILFPLFRKSIFNQLGRFNRMNEDLKVYLQK